MSVRAGSLSAGELGKADTTTSAPDLLGHMHKNTKINLDFKQADTTAKPHLSLLEGRPPTPRLNRSGASQPVRANPGGPGRLLGTRRMPKAGVLTS